MEDESFVEKYRPKKLDELVSIDKEMIRKMLENPKQMPHLLLVSKTPGTGKTTLAKIIINELDADHIIINSSKDRSLEIIRDTVSRFSMNMSSKPGIPRIVILDEIDGMRAESQNALRGVMEDFSSNCKFILTGNNINKIVEAIQSRCTKINFKILPKEEIKKRLNFVIDNEKLDIQDKEKVVDKLISIYYPSIRNMINNLQLATFKGVINEASFQNETEFEQQIWNMFKSNSLREIRTKVIESGRDIEELTLNIFDIMIKENHANEKQITLKFRDAAYRLAVGSDPEITFAGLVIELKELV